jgi:hypothetical protein
MSLDGMPAVFETVCGRWKPERLHSRVLYVWCRLRLAFDKTSLSASGLRYLARPYVCIGGVRGWDASDRGQISPRDGFVAGPLGLRVIDPSDVGALRDDRAEARLAPAQRMVNGPND